VRAHNDSATHSDVVGCGIKPKNSHSQNHKTPKKVNRLEMEEKELWQEVEI
jgi:hypothetical protein